MQVLFAHLVYGNCSKIKMIILISYLRAKRFQWIFLLSHLLFLFNTLRIVYSMEKTPIIDCITHLLLMTLHSECCLIIWFTNVRCLQQILFLFYQPSVELELWMQFHVFKKVSNISRFDRDRQSQMRDNHLSLHALGKVKTNRPRASQICIGVIIVLSIKRCSGCATF